MSELHLRNLKALASIDDEAFTLVVRFWAFEQLRGSGLADTDINKEIALSAKSASLSDVDINIGAMRAEFVGILDAHAEDAAFMNDIDKAIDKSLNMAKFNSGIEILLTSTAIAMVVATWKLKGVSLKKESDSLSLDAQFNKVGDGVATAAIKVIAKFFGIG